MRMSQFRWVLPVPLLGALACLNAPVRATLQDVSDASGDADDAQAETVADALEVETPDAAAEAPDQVAPDGEDVPIDLRPDDEAVDDEGDADVPDAPAPDDSEVAEVADVAADSPAEVVPDTTPEASSDPGTDGETVAPPSIRCAGRTGGGGIVGANGVWMRGMVGGGVRALRIGE